MALNEPTQPKANLRDLVAVEGYEGKTFKVTAVMRELSYEDFIEIEEISYDLFCEEDSTFLMSFDEDITIVSSAAKPPKDDVITTDDLLIELSDYLALEKAFGKDEEYTAKITGIKERLRKITGVK